MMLLFFFCFGLIIGSFLNVVILRGEASVSLGGRSHCPHCQTTIAWYDNIPVLSYGLLRGKCRACRQPIALQYPLVELVTGALFAGVGYVFFQPSVPEGTSMVLAGAYLVLLSFLLLIFVSDLRTMEIPLGYLVGALAAAGLIVALEAFFPGTDPRIQTVLTWGNQIGGGIVAGLIFFGLVYYSHETWMGMGDVWLATVLGLMVGAVTLLWALTLSFAFGAAVGMTAIILGQKKMGSRIPFGPFLIVGLVLTWYLQWASPAWFSLFLFPVELFL